MTWPARTPINSTRLLPSPPAAPALPSASASFVLRPDLFWTNTGRTVASLQADLGTGSGFVAMSWNVPQPVSYASAGTKDVRVRVTYTDGSTFESHLRVLAPTPRPMGRQRNVLFPDGRRNLYLQQPPGFGPHLNRVRRAQQNQPQPHRVVQATYYLEGV